MIRKCLGFGGIVCLLAAFSAAPAMANHIDTATLTIGCSSYTLSVSASALNPGQNYTIDYQITLTPSSGSPLHVTGSIGPFTSSASGTFSASVTNSLGPLSGNFTASGSAMLVGENTVAIIFSADNSTTLNISCPISPPPPRCPEQSANTSNFNGTPIEGGTYIWFNANFTASGIPSSGTTISFTNSTIQFDADHAYNLAVPNARITFSPSATCASTSFDTLTNTWMTTVPIAGSDEIFLSGLAFRVPATFANAGGKVNGNVVWQGTFGTNVPGITIHWKWGAAVYSTFSTNYNLLSVKPTHSNSCSFNNSDHAGTPEGVDSQSGKPFKAFVIGGARGGGGSNWTGSWSGTVSVAPLCPTT